MEKRDREMSPIPLTVPLNELSTCKKPYARLHERKMIPDSLLWIRRQSGKKQDLSSSAPHCFALTDRTQHSFIPLVILLTEFAMKTTRIYAAIIISPRRWEIISSIKDIHRRPYFSPPVLFYFDGWRPRVDFQAATSPQIINSTSGFFLRRRYYVHSTKRDVPLFTFVQTSCH